MAAILKVSRQIKNHLTPSVDKYLREEVSIPTKFHYGSNLKQRILLLSLKNEKVTVTRRTRTMRWVAIMRSVP